MQTPYQTNAAGHLSIGGVDANELAQLQQPSLLLA